jgi:hypothetical protein
VLLSSIATPISFANGLVTGIELAVNPSVGFGYHGFNTSEHFSFNTTPLPAALPLFASGLGGLGYLSWRRRKRRAASTA